MRTAHADLGLDALYVVYPGDKRDPAGGGQSKRFHSTRSPEGP